MSSPVLFPDRVLEAVGADELERFQLEKAEWSE